MKPGAITLLTSALVERGLNFVGKVDEDHKTVRTALPVVAVSPREINYLATKLANRAFETIKGTKLVFTTPRVERDYVLIDIAAAKSKAKAEPKAEEPEIVDANPAVEVQGVDIYAYLPEPEER
jgi:hypothetical protein